MNTRREFFATAASGLAWLCGWKAKSATGGSDLGSKSDWSAITGKVSYWHAVQNEPHLWTVWVKFDGGGSASYAAKGDSSVLPRIGSLLTIYTTRSKPCES